MAKVNEIERELTDEEYGTILDEVFEEVVLGNLTFQPSRIIQELDPIAFNCGKADEESKGPRYECDECGDTFDDYESAEECCPAEEVPA